MRNSPGFPRDENSCHSRLDAAIFGRPAKMATPCRRVSLGGLGTVPCACVDPHSARVLVSVALAHPLSGVRSPSFHSILFRLSLRSSLALESGRHLCRWGLRAGDVAAPAGHRPAICGLLCRKSLGLWLIGNDCSVVVRMVGQSDGRNLWRTYRALNVGC